MTTQHATAMGHKDEGARLRVAVLGAGAMGCLFGGCLFEAGTDVTLIDIDEEHISAIRGAGLRLATDAGDRRVPLPIKFPREVSATFDLVIVFTKTTHTRPALSGISKAIGAETMLLSLQNGLDNQQVLAEFAAPERVLVGVTSYPADLCGPGFVRSHGAGTVHLPDLGQTPSPTRSGLVELFTAAGLVAQQSVLVEKAIWEKVAFNAGLNSVSAVTGSTVGQIGAQADSRSLVFEIVREVCRTALAVGIQADLVRVKAMVGDAMALHGEHKPSMLQDIIAGRQTEIEAVNGAVVRRAEELGVPVIATATMLKLVRHLELQGRSQRLLPTKPVAISMASNNSQTESSPE